MENNDILRRLRYTLDYNDSTVMRIHAQAGDAVPISTIRSWFKREEEEGYKPVSDKHLAQFLNGVIIEERGKKEGPLPEPEKRLTNNIILRKLKIALNLKDTDMLEILKLADFNISRGELSAFFRKPDQDKYRLCKDQIMRNFLNGLQIKINGPKKDPENQ